MKYGLSKPCKDCPFRTDVPGYLRRDRAQEIAREIARGSTFPCHKTTVPDPEDESARMATQTSQMCAGAIIVMEHEDAPNQMLRIAERIGLYDRRKMDMNAPVHRSFAAFIRHHGDGDDWESAEPCSICGDGCEAPAGWMEGGVVVTNEDIDPSVMTVCPECEQPVCETCAQWCCDY